jgi:hypothetical protein
MSGRRDASSKRLVVAVVLVDSRSKVSTLQKILFIGECFTTLLAAYCDLQIAEILGERTASVD